MRRTLTLAILLGTIGAGGCLSKQKRRAPLAIDQPLPPLPSALEKAQPPTPPQPAAPLATNTLPDTGEYRSVPIPAAPQPLVEAPVTIPVSATLPEPDAADEERKRLLERLREKREKEKEPEKEKPMLPSAIAPKDPPKEQPKAQPKVDANPSSKPAGNDLAGARMLYGRLLAKYRKLNDYECIMTRREVVGGKEMPTEEVLFQFRKEPFSVYMRNLGEVGKGREVLYVDGKFDGLMHVVSGQGDVAKFLVGFKTSLKPDSAMATSKSRHKITEAGPGHHLAKIDKYLKLAESGKTTVKYLGNVTRKDQPNALEGMEIAIPPGEDALLPKGGKWVLFFEPNTELPNYGNLMVHQMFDETGREVEYYCFTKFRVPANLTDADFHPDRLGGKKK
jgi:Protein of unknown function (DUF1571)